jgi:hypothetical protein
MANTFLTPQIIATRALATLYETTVMAQLVHRDFEADFRGKQGDTITVRKPATFTAQEFDRGTGIVPQNATETGVDVTLNHFADVSFNVTTEQLNLEIEDFGTQLLDPAMEAIAQKIDTDLLTLRNDIVQTAGATTGRELTKPEILIDAGRILNQKKVPTTDRYAVIGPVANADWLDSDILKKVNESGSTGRCGRRTWDAACSGSTRTGRSTSRSRRRASPSTAPRSRSSPGRWRSRRAHRTRRS